MQIEEFIDQKKKGLDLIKKTEIKKKTEEENRIEKEESE